ncbi:MAG: thioredoxin domain-containing protein, partial [SAR324 cluster bacterium]|nr:thioredoxin domain-containing protein [SAR324 cluster bacterium]
FVNIFIDADIHNGIYLKYRATGVPYTVFLNPDHSVYFKYSGVLYAEDFLEVIRGVQENVAVGKSLYGDDEELEAYLPPKEFNLAKLESLHQLLNDGVLDNIDWKHAGLGQGQKTIHPQLSLYLLENSSVEDQEEHLEWIIPSLEQAIRHLYDPLEGGFYRYAETREWEVAHFEKMADLNAGMVALLQKVNQLSPTPEFEKTAEQTLKYLVKTLYSEELGVFLSFQEADTFYYFLNAEGRSQGKTPEVIQRIFTDRLSRTLLQLMAIEGIPGSFQLDQKILSSLDFLASMVIREKQIYHFYDMSNGEWETPGGLEDLALLAVVFAEAAKKYRKPHYLHALKKLHQLAREKNYDRGLQIFSDHNL